MTPNNSHMVANHDHVRLNVANYTNHAAFSHWSPQHRQSVTAQSSGCDQAPDNNQKPEAHSKRVQKIKFRSSNYKPQHL
jgi:hypothetical protein